MNNISQRRARLESPNTTHTHNLLRNEQIGAMTVARAAMGRGSNGDQCMIWPVAREAVND